MLVLLISWVHTSTIESLHASVRKLIHRVTQTHVQEFADIQCAWLAQAARRMKCYAASFTASDSVRALGEAWLKPRKPPKPPASRKRKLMRSDGAPPKKPKARWCGELGAHT